MRRLLALAALALAATALHTQTASAQPLEYVVDLTPGVRAYTKVITSASIATIETPTSTLAFPMTGVNAEQTPILGVFVVTLVVLSVVGLIVLRKRVKGASGVTYVATSFSKHFAGKAATALVTLGLAFLLNFFLFYVPMPEEPAGWYYEPEQPKPPIWDQFSSYLDFVFIEGFGNSFSYRNIRALDLVAEKLLWTMLLMGLSLPIAILIGVVAGAVASWMYGKRLDTVISWSLLASYATPTWLVAIFFILYPCFQLRLFPIGGFYGDKWLFVSAWSDPIGFTVDVLWHLAPAAMVLAIGQVGLYFLVTKSGMADVFDEPYIFAAKARGLRPRSVVFKHALRNAALPIVTVMAFSPVLVMTATILVEVFFSKAGLGWLLINSIERPGYLAPRPALDYPVLQAAFMTFTVVVVLASLVAETLYGYLDPRIRRGQVKLVLLEETPIVGPRTSARARWRSRLMGLARVPTRLKELLARRGIGAGIGKMRRFWSDYRKSRSGLLGLFVVLFFAILAVLAPLSPYDPNALELETFQPPSLEHWLGTDENGRDVLTRLAWGAQASVVECLGTVAIATFVGCLLGSVSGYYDRRWFSYLIDRLTDLFLSVPLIALVIFFPYESELYSALGAMNVYWTISPLTLRSIVLTGITTWGITARLVRSRVLSAKEKAYVEGVKAAGGGEGYILFRHVFPEAVRVAFSSIFYTAVVAITLQSSLDILGFQNPWRLTASRTEVEMAYGTARSPVLTWGTMISWTVLFHPTTQAWWATLPPGISLALLALSLILVGNAVSDLLNPLKREQMSSKVKRGLTFR